MNRSPTNAVVADTHALIWFIFNPTRLSVQSRDALRAAENTGEAIYVSAITFVEMRYLFEKRKISEMDYADTRRLIQDSTSVLTLVPIGIEITDALKNISRADVPDMPDRIIAATGLHLGLPLVTRDGKIRASNVTTIW